MGPETREAPLIPTGDELLAEVQGVARPAKRPDTELVQIKLTLDQASFLWVKLYELTQKPSRMKPETIRKELLTVPPALLEYLWDRLLDLCPTTPYVLSEQGRVRFVKQGLTLELRKHQAKYLLRILKNKRRDKWRRENLERELFAPLEVVEIAEAGNEEDDLSDGVRRAFFRPTHHENPEAQVHRAVLKKALKDLPRTLKLPAKEVKLLLNAIMGAEGNVSEAARIVAQPQRKTARRIQRILAHLKSRGFSA